uniref:Secreted protein n=1 Tax=Eutreptiella gymnastica TaxID=73025 RepID=A0A7S1ND15_9EUGL
MGDFVFKNLRIHGSLIFTLLVSNIRCTTAFQGPSTKFVDCCKLHTARRAVFDSKTRCTDQVVFLNFHSLAVVGLGTPCHLWQCVGWWYWPSIHICFSPLL